ncbi:unnamed protein product [Symbiodinium natans]|uniref:OmpA-like domain-containing protein n=1 Tax=Symbiodinium natans TaxID=878477 RepID=A0A812NWM6_9DINO|nr:unnamed protein product [Symbiodinium natans]
MSGCCGPLRWLLKRAARHWAPVWGLDREAEGGKAVRVPVSPWLGVVLIKCRKTLHGLSSEAVPKKRHLHQEAKSPEKRCLACPCETCAKAAAFLTSPQGIECLGAACADPEILARLSLCSRSQHRTVHDAEFLQRRAAELGKRVASPARLEQLAFSVAVEPLCGLDTNHIYFSYGGGSQLQGSELPFLAKAAALARRFSRVNVHIDAHAGVRAPGRLVAKRTSQARAKAILKELVAQGLPENRISFTAWGRLVSAAWPENERVARAEVYFKLDDMVYPERPEYYNVRSQLGLASPADSEEEAVHRLRLRHVEDDLLLFVPATTGFQLVSIANTA